MFQLRVQEHANFATRISGEVTGQGAPRTLLLRLRQGTHALLMHRRFLLPSSLASFLLFRRPLGGALCSRPAFCMPVEMSIFTEPGAGLSRGLARHVVGLNRRAPAASVVGSWVQSARFSV